MVYTQQHTYLTFHWSVAAAVIEQGQFGIRINQSTLPSPTERAAVKGLVQTFWADVENAIPSYFRLEMLKWAEVQPDGLYPEGFVPVLDEYGTPIAGGGTSVRQFPLQIAHAISLTTDAERGRAHRGRIYMPALGQNLGTDDRWPATVVDPRAEAVATMLGAINSAVTGVVVVMSKIGAGTTRPVTGVAAGTRPDVQRRRAAQIAEEYVLQPVP